MSKRKNTFGENTAVTLLGPTGYDNVITILKYMPDLMDLYDALLGSGGGSLTVDSIVESTLDAGITIDGQTLIKDGEVTSVTFNGVAITTLGSATQFLAGDGTYQTLVETDISDLDKYTQAEVDSAINAATASMNELSELTDTTITTPVVRHALMYDGVDSWDNRLLVELDISDLDKYTQAQVDTNIGVVNTALGTHTGDTTIHFTQAAIDITASQVNDFSTAVNALVGSTDVDGLNNVTITTPALGNILVYNTTGTVWENQTLASQDIATLTAMATADGLRVATAGDTMDSAADLTFAGGGEVLGLPATPSATGAASKEYVDTQIGGVVLSEDAFGNIIGGTSAADAMLTNGAAYDNVVIGELAMVDAVTVTDSTIVGNEAMHYTAGTHTRITAFGSYTFGGHPTQGAAAIGPDSSAFGASAGKSAKGSKNSIFGSSAFAGGNTQFPGDDNAIFGYRAMDSVTDSTNGAHQNSVFGSLACDQVSGNCDTNTVFGYKAMEFGSNCNNNVVLGANAGARMFSGASNSVIIGPSAGPLTQSNPTNELWINNTQSDTPLIFGDFATPKVTINGALEATGDITASGNLALQSNAPLLYMLEDDASANEKIYDLSMAGGVFQLRVVADAYASTDVVFNVTRTGALADAFNFQVPVTGTDAPTAVSHLTRKDYVDDNFVSLAGDTMTGNLDFSKVAPSITMTDTGLGLGGGNLGLWSSSGYIGFGGSGDTPANYGDAYFEIDLNGWGADLDQPFCYIGARTRANATIHNTAFMPTGTVRANSCEKADITDVKDLTTKEYVDDNFLPITGGTLTGALFVNHESPTYNWVESGHTVDNKNWDMVADAGVMYLRVVNDAYTVAGNALTITRSGTSITSVGIGGDIETTVNKVIDMGSWVSTTDHIQLYGAGGVGGFGLGVESSTLYYRSQTTHRFYTSSIANGGVSGVAMNLSSTECDVKSTNLKASGNLQTLGVFTVDNAQPQIKLYENDAATDEKFWRFYASGGVLVFDIHNDANSVAAQIFTVERTADAVDVINFITDMQVNKQLFFDAVVANTTATAVNWTNGNKQSIAPTAATSPTYTFTAPGGPTNLTLSATNLGAVTAVTWPATVKWPGGTEPTWTSSGTDIINFYYDGTNYHGAASLDSK